VLSTNSTERLRITSSGGVSFGATGTAYGSSGQILQSNGNAAPTWIALSSRTVGTSTQVNTVLQAANASYYPTFVDSNNASAAAESLYTTSSFQINPFTGNIQIGMTGQDYQPSSGGNHTLRLNAANTSSIGFHDSGSTIGNLKFSGNFGFEIGAYDGLYGPHNTILHGNVGVGTASPAAKLHIAVASAAVDGTKGVRITNPAGTIAVFECGSVGDSFIGTTSGSDFNIRTNNAVVATFLNGGNVGIGTTAPDSKLHVEVGNATAYTPANTLVSGQTARISNTDATSGVSANLLFVAKGAGGGNGLGSISGVNTGVGSLAFTFGTRHASSNVTERMRITSDGNVVIGATTTTNKFEVAGTAGQLFSVSDSFTGTIFAASDVSGIPSIEVLDTGLVKFAQYGGQVAIGTGTVASSTVTVSIYGMVQTMGTLGEIRASSEITAYFSSDRRLKENIKLIENPITIIDQIRGVTFDWTDEHMARRGGEDGYFVRKHDIGVIAQEVQAVLPELVGTREDGYLAVKYEKMVPLLIEAIKAQQKTIDSLVRDLADVKEFINQLKNKDGI
jgi:hypothetical protein